MADDVARGRCRAIRSPAVPLARDTARVCPRTVRMLGNHVSAPLHSMGLHQNKTRMPPYGRVDRSLW
eukprot:3161498-Prymnesium_polylepis.1